MGCEPKVENHCIDSQTTLHSHLTVAAEDGCAGTYCLLFLKGQRKHKEGQSCLDPSFVT